MTHRPTSRILSLAIAAILALSLSLAAAARTNIAPVGATYDRIGSFGSDGRAFALTYTAYTPTLTAYTLGTLGTSGDFKAIGSYSGAVSLYNDYASLSLPVGNKALFKNGAMYDSVSGVASITPTSALYVVGLGDSLIRKYGVVNQTGAVVLPLSFESGQLSVRENGLIVASRKVGTNTFYDIYNGGTKIVADASNVGGYSNDYGDLDEDDDDDYDYIESSAASAISFAKVGANGTTYGLASLTGVTEAAYNSVSYLGDEIYRVAVNGTYSLVGPTGNAVAAAGFPYTAYLGNGLFSQATDTAYNIVNLAGGVILTSATAPVSYGGEFIRISARDAAGTLLYGLANKAGAVVLQPSYTNLTGSSSGVFYVNDAATGKAVYGLASQARLLTTPVYENLYILDDTNFYTRNSVDKSVTVISGTTGAAVLGPTTYTKSLGAPYCAYAAGAKYNVVDVNTQKPVINGVDAIYEIAPGYFAVTKGVKVGVVNTAGATVVGFDYDSITNANPYGTFTYVGKEYNVASNGLLIARKGGKASVIKIGTFFTVTFKNGKTVLSTQTVEQGKAAVKPANPTKAGFKFKSWSASVPSKVTKDITLTAKWTGTKQNIKYKLAGGKLSTKTKTYVTGKGVSLKKIVPTKTGYKFTGWKQKIGKKTKTVKSIGKTQIGAVTLTATWKKAQ